MLIMDDKTTLSKLNGLVNQFC